MTQQSKTPSLWDEVRKPRTTTTLIFDPPPTTTEPTGSKVAKRRRRSASTGASSAKSHIHSLADTKEFFQTLFDDLQLSAETTKCISICQQTLNALDNVNVLTTLRALDSKAEALSKYYDLEIERLRPKTTKKNDEEEGERLKRSSQSESDTFSSLEKRIAQSRQEISKITKLASTLRKEATMFKALNTNFRQSLDERYQLSWLDSFISMTISTVNYFSGDVRKWDCSPDISTNMLPLTVTHWANTIKKKYGSSITSCDFKPTTPYTPSHESSNTAMDNTEDDTLVEEIEALL